MNLNQLYYFREAARLQHFTAAAEAVHVSQPSLSYAISNLEDELQVQLFDRRGRSLILTKYGDVFLEHVDKVLGELELGVQHINQMAGSDAGRIDIAYLYPLAPLYIPKAAREFLSMEENKNVAFTFFQGATTSLIAGLKNHKYDVVFASYVEDEPDIEFTPLIVQEMKLTVPEEHPLADRKSITVKELEGYPFVAYHKETGLGKLSSEIFQDAGIIPNVISEAENEQAIYGLVAEHFGIALAAEIPAIKNFKVKAIPVECDLCRRYIHLAYMKNRYFPPAVKRFIKYIKTVDMEI